MFKGLDKWLPGYLFDARPRLAADGVTDIMICVCDHFEPFHAANRAEALARMAHWKREFPRMIEAFRDSDGCRPRHTFFYPIEQYDREVIDELAELCRLSGGEAELHLHHDRDTAEKLSAKLEEGKARFREHGLLPVDEQGRVRYGFVHGDWALDNSHPEGRNCGVQNELGVLQATGCYADFTLPSAPSPTQTRTINSIYYATNTGGVKSHDRGVAARVNSGRSGSQLGPGEMLLVQGPLALNWERRKWGVFPRIENADLTGRNPPRADRMRVWMRAGVQVAGRPEWCFIKLHAHGAIPQNSGTLLGEPMRSFHQYLAERYRGRCRVHYVSARELVNIVHAAEQGCAGDAGKYRDYLLKSPGSGSSG
jgi:hypothetical protein